MTELQDLRSVIQELPKRENIETLQARLARAGLEENLGAVAAGKVPETFVAAMTSLLERLEKGLGSISVGEILQTTAEVKRAEAALESTPKTEVTAETILKGFKKHSDGMITFTLPIGVTIEQAGRILNLAAQAKGMRRLPFSEYESQFWEKNEADEDLQTVPGQKYIFKIQTDSVDKTRLRQVNDHGKGAPLGAIAIAEACERLRTGNNSTLFKDANGNKVLVRGATPGKALMSDDANGATVVDGIDARGLPDMAFAASVPVWDKKA